MFECIELEKLLVWWQTFKQSLNQRRHCRERPILFWELICIYIYQYEYAYGAFTHVKLGNFTSMYTKSVKVSVGARTLFINQLIMIYDLSSLLTAQINYNLPIFHSLPFQPLRPVYRRHYVKMWRWATWCCWVRDLWSAGECVIHQNHLSAVPPG